MQRELLRIPDRFLGAEVERIHCVPLRKIVSRYFERWKETGAKGWGLVLSGPNGVGKSWALASMLIHAFDHRLVRAGLFVLAEEFFRLGNPMAHVGLGDEAYTEGGEQTWRDYYMEVPLLAVCDLGKEDRRGKLADTAPLTLGSILRARVQKRLPTLFDTNLSTADEGENTVRAVYGDSIHDLMQECEVFVGVTGKSLRKIAQQKMKDRLTQE